MTKTKITIERAKATGIMARVRQFFRTFTTRLKRKFQNK